jgi:acyl-coenzyme A synthetase/AMP-(fatty) acid ligase
MLVALLGLLRAGLSVVLAHPARFEALAAIPATTLVFERGAPTLEGGENIPFNDAVLDFDPEAARLNKPLPLTNAGGGDILCFTSGTTGRPKLVVCPQASWQERVTFPLNPVFFNYERILIVPGLITSWALSRAYEALHFGRTICLAPPNAARLWLWLANTYDVDTILVSPKQAVDLAELQENTERFPLRSLKSVHIGAGSIGRDGAKRVKQNLCRSIVMIYGSTEAGVTAVAPYDMIAGIDCAVGYILPSVHVEIVDQAHRVLPAGKEGLVRIRSPVFAGNMAASKSSEEWFYPGDIGWVTEDALLCIRGRIGDVVNRGGEKLSISDFENFLLTCPGVADAGVCTNVARTGLQEIWVGLVLKPGADIGAIRIAIEDNAHFKNNVDKIFVVDAIPRGTIGKVQRDELKKLLQSIMEQAELPEAIQGDFL